MPANTGTGTTKEYWELIQLNQSRCESQLQCQFKTRWLRCFEEEEEEERRKKKVYLENGL